jgi:hypothetical protein
MNSQSLVINTLQVSYLLDVKAADKALDTRGRLDRVARELLKSALERRFAQHARDNAPYVFIDELEVHFDLNLSETADDNSASIWARAIDDAVHRALSINDASILVYGSRAEFVATFIEDLISGRASANWHYQYFDDLQSLLTAQVLQRVLTLEPDVGRDALLHITGHQRLQQVLGFLGESERETVVRACFLPSSPGVSSPGQIEIWVDALLELLENGPTPVQRDRWSVVAEIYLNLLHTNPQLGSDVNLARFIRDLVWIVREPNVQRFITGLRTGKPANLHSRLDSTEARKLTAHLGRTENRTRLVELLEIMTGIVSGHRPLARSAASSMAPNTGEASGRVLPDEAVTIEFVSDFAGIYLLIPAAVTLKLSDFLDRLPAPDPLAGNRTGLLLFIIASQCLGRERWQRVQSEQSLQHFAGLDYPIDVETLAANGNNQITGFSITAARQWEKHLSNAVDQYRRIAVPPVTDDYCRWFATEPLGFGERHSELWNAMSAPSSMLLRFFASELGALASNSPEYIARNFLESRAIVTFTDSRVAVRFIRSNLQVLLRMLGFEERTTVVPWLGERVLTLKFV